jgi:transposase
VSTSLLDHAFGIRGYQSTRTDYQDGQVIFTIHQEPETCRCSACEARDVQSRGHVVRRFRSLPLGSQVTSVVLPIPRVACRTCGVTRQVAVPFADPRRSSTKAFERYALELSRRMTIRDVALHLDVSWDVIKDLQKRDLSHRSASIRSSYRRIIRSRWFRWSINDRSRKRGCSVTEPCTATRSCGSFPRSRRRARSASLTRSSRDPLGGEPVGQVCASLRGLSPS